MRNQYSDRWREAAVALLLLQGCYVDVGDKRYGQEDTAFPNADIEGGCVVSIERGGKLFPPDYVVMFRKLDGSRETFERNAEAGAKLTVGKCYEWKLGFHDGSIGSLFEDGVDAMKAIASDTLREIASEGESEAFRLYVSNECNRGLRLAVKYRDISNSWQVIGWWNFEPKTSRYLAFETGEFALTTSSILFYYAESIDGTLFWGDEGNEVAFEGRKLPMAQLEDKSGDTEWTLRCD